MTESDGLAAEAGRTLAWAGTIFRPGSETGRALRSIAGRLTAEGATLSPGEPSEGTVTYGEVREALDREWPPGSDLAEAVAGLVERLREPEASPSP